MADRSTNCNHFRRSLTSRGKGSPLVWPFRLGGDAEPRSRDHGSTHPPVRDHAVVEDRNGEPANKLIGKTGTPFWQREYYDRWIRSPKELSSVIAYVEDNPVRTGLLQGPKNGVGQAHSKNRQQDRRRCRNATPSLASQRCAAVPVTFGASGVRTFYSDQTMVFHQNFSAEPATANSPEMK